ncbi:hypothetical protein CHU95_14320 [Niveispirillum lacus]|uniref:Uncharacterized protein n=1 Tax=Niveispirillum lacus TaxID=1981099 RepID=A0A255YWE0_9PROT|nr:hypothetical protein [Niveispirillum lacus]OYQ33557.1 hypothetical protein CHU95_14320 [Niveispirillum lacus]
MESFSRISASISAYLIYLRARLVDINGSQNIDDWPSLRQSLEDFIQLVKYDKSALADVELLTGRTAVLVGTWQRDPDIVKVGIKHIERARRIFDQLPVTMLAHETRLLFRVVTRLELANAVNTLGDLSQSPVQDRIASILRDASRAIHRYQKHHFGNDHMPSLLRPSYDIAKTAKITQLRFQFALISLNSSSESDSIRWQNEIMNIMSTSSIKCSWEFSYFGSLALAMDAARHIDENPNDPTALEKFRHFVQSAQTQLNGQDVPGTRNRLLLADDQLVDALARRHF